MAGIQTIFTLLVVCLMNGFLCIQTKREFNITIPETVEVLTGSCLTIPCSFDIREQYDKDLNKDCKGKWVYPDASSPNLKPVDEIGNLTEKNCTSTFLKMNSGHAGKSRFRLECDNKLKWTFTNLTVIVNIIDRPPSPTLSPSALTVKEGTSVSLTCSAQASCLSHPPTLTWTPKLADSQETLKENQNQTKVQISVLNFTASHLHHGKIITCTAVYWKHGGGSSLSANSSLTANIIYEEPLLLIIPLTVALLALMCVLLFVIRFVNKRHKLNTGPLVDRNEETAEDSIYAKTSELGEEDPAQPLNGSQRTSDNFSSSASTEGPSVSPGNDQEDVTYSSVTFKAKRNSKAGKKSGDCEKSCQTEERFVVEDAGKNFVRNALEMGTVYAEVVTKKKVECEYASVNFKTKTNNLA
ncbi:uncharacterized protein LOC112143780 [Oryzias melastigma]|uniref:uncharacterized protein LOC112143780 n=1 Tax=Oryzias melastigma TaxID=30732 RepID=UPI00168D8C42|nr:uncharacterized protein LOC112143780 [Oryzias melastigma]